MTITNLPSPLPGESFQCVFGGFGSGDLTAVSGDMFSCNVPNVPSLVGGGEHIITVCVQCVHVCSTYSIHNSMHLQSV